VPSRNAVRGSACSVQHMRIEHRALVYSLFAHVGGVFGGVKGDYTVVSKRDRKGLTNRARHEKKEL